mgnify:CR=1 FL=1|tara:strand:- start:16010 stop:17770 length:1761 start_codon:yes stop_codon:yes gene_type:complete
MYDISYSSNFATNFVTSSLFLILILSNSFLISSIIQKKNIKLFSNSLPIVIFFLFFLFFSFVFNILLIFNANKLLIFFFYFALALSIFLSLINVRYFINTISKKNVFSLEKDKSTKFILLVLFIFYLITILPISDADSLALHQYFATYIFKNGLTDLDIIKYFEFSLFTNSEILLLFSPMLKSDNFGSQLNFFTLVIFFILFPKKKNFFLFLVSCPLIIFFISTQKLQLFFSILFLLLFILVHKKLIKNKIEIFIFTLLILFYISGKLSYILIGGPLFIYFLILNKQNYKFIIFASFISLLFTLFPIFFLKSYYFGNPFLPFFDSYFNDRSIMDAFSLSVRSSEGWLFNFKDLKIFIKPFVPLTLSGLSGSLGLIFLITLFNLSLIRSVYYLPLIIIILVLFTGQILPRYYFEAFLILIFFFNYNDKKLVKYALFLQLFVILSLSISFVFIAYVNENVLMNKSKYMNRFSYSYFNSTELEKLNITDNVLAFSLDRNSIFIEENFYPTRYINSMNLINKNKNKNIINYIMENSIKYIIIRDVQKIPKCFSVLKVDEIYQKKSIRNFLIKNKKNIFNVYKINNNRCGT